MKVLLILILCSIAFGCSSLDTRHKGKLASNFVKDSSSAFLEYFEVTLSNPQTNLEQSFRNIVLPQNSDFYEYRLESLKISPGGTEAQLKRNLEEFKSLRIHGI
jgi:hypothetical protein